MKYIVNIIFFSICIFSCQNEKSIQAEKILKKWLDKNIIFPENLNFIILRSERPSNFALRDR